MTLATRYTSTSRRPGLVVVGHLRRPATAFVQCPACGGTRWARVGEAAPGPHSPHLESRGGALVLVDCIGAPILDAARRGNG